VRTARLVQNTGGNIRNKLFRIIENNISMGVDRYANSRRLGKLLAL